ncbi:MAG: DUF4340 domain-containing protein [Clostridia bacterium]|nr:DUF4340 domain-containing protein [Clostridia bacterium]
MKKQKILAIAAFCAAVVLILLYFFVISPVLLAEDPADTEETQKPLENEVINESGRTLLFPHYERESIQSIEVYNSNGKYTVYRNAEDTFVLNGFEELSLDPTVLSSVIVGAGYSITMNRITEEAEDLSEYGLDPEKDDPAWYRLTTIDEKQYKVYIGKKLVSDAGYYVCLEDSRAVYTITNSLLDTMFLGKENIAAKQITTTIASTDMMKVTKFAVMKGEDTVVSVKSITEAEAESLGLDINYQLVVPKGYNLNVTTYTAALECFSSFEATEIAAIGITKSKLEKFGLTGAPYSIYFELNGEETYLTVSEKTEDGKYYVASHNNDVIGVYPAESLPFLETDVIRWVDQSIYMVNINEIAEIKIESNRVNETFTLEGEGQDLIVTTSEGLKPDVKNFRQFYKTLLSTYIQGYSELSDEEIEAAKSKEPQLTFTYTTRAGKTTVYQFYTISERKSICVIDGEGGEFYYLYTHANKISSDCIKIINGEPVDSEDRN